MSEPDSFRRKERHLRVIGKNRFLSGLFELLNAILSVPFLNPVPGVKLNNVAQRIAERAAV